MNIKRLYLLFFLFPFIYAQGLRVIHMEGTYDLDGDGTVTDDHSSYNDSGGAPYLGGGSNLWWFVSR